MTTIAYLGAKDVGRRCLESLLSMRDVDVVAVGTKANAVLDGKATVASVAAQHGIRLLGELDELLELPEVDFIVSVQYHELLRDKHIRRARRDAVNFHMAPLPEYRGCNQFSFAILDGAREFGTTVHRMEVSVDGGPIIAERRFAMPEGVDVATLYDMTCDHTVQLFQDTMPVIVAGDYDVTPQADLVAERGTSFHRRNEIDALRVIDLDWPAERIARHVRAVSMPGFPRPYAIVGGRKIELVLDKEKP